MRGQIEVDRDVSTAPTFDAQAAHMASGDSAAMLFWTSESDGGGDILQRAPHAV